MFSLSGVSRSFAVIIGSIPSNVLLPGDLKDLFATCGASCCSGVRQAIVRAVRNARAEYGVELGRKIAATVLIRGDEALR